VEGKVESWGKALSLPMHSARRGHEVEAEMIACGGGEGRYHNPRALMIVADTTRSRQWQWNLREGNLLEDYLETNLRSVVDIPTAYLPL